MTIKTIAVFHAFASRVCAWSCAEGIIDTLRRMGYIVIDCGRPPQKTVGRLKVDLADLIIVSGPEIFWNAAEYYYPFWSELKAPKVAWYTESAHRDDRDFDFASLKRIADLHYYPAAQDAEEFGGTWLPFGVDTAMFRPKPVEVRHSAAFIGMVYPKRAAFAEALPFTLDHVIPQQSTDVRESFEFLVDAYCSTEIFVNLPSLSRLLVTKVTEAMACGRVVITPEIDHPSGLKNMNQFENGRHLVYYTANRPDQLGNVIEYVRRNTSLRERIVSAGLGEIHRAHTLEHRLRKIIADVEGAA